MEDSYIMSAMPKGYEDSSCRGSMSGCYYGKSLDILQKIKSLLLQRIYRKGSYVWNCWIHWKK